MQILNLKQQLAPVWNIYKQQLLIIIRQRVDGVPLELLLGEPLCRPRPGGPAAAAHN